uniref:Uncharacterized protein n=1 Tax=Anguilla anguilla TaxID=7936 RepID=A0A0E9PP67_ANGAN
MRTHSLLKLPEDVSESQVLGPSFVCTNVRISRVQFKASLSKVTLGKVSL